VSSAGGPAAPAVAARGPERARGPAPAAAGVGEGPATAATGCTGRPAAAKVGESPATAGGPEGKPAPAAAAAAEVGDGTAVGRLRV